MKPTLTRHMPPLLWQLLCSPQGFLRSGAELCHMLGELGFLVGLGSAEFSADFWKGSKGISEGEHWRWLEFCGLFIVAVHGSNFMRS